MEESWKRIFPHYISIDDLEMVVREWQLLGISVVPLCDSTWIVCDIRDIQGTVCLYTESICGWTQDLIHVQKNLTNELGLEMEELE